MRQSIRKYSWTPACDNQLENSTGPLCATVNLKILLDTRVQQSIEKYSWTPACDNQFENTLGHPCATVNKKMLLDTHVDSQFENTPRHPCDSHFPKGISALSWSFPLENWNKTNMYEMITQQCKPCQQCQQCKQFIAQCYLHNCNWWYFLRDDIIQIQSLKKMQKQTSLWCHHRSIGNAP